VAEEEDGCIKRYFVRVLRHIDKVKVSSRSRIKLEAVFNIKFDMVAAGPTMYLW